MLRYTVRVELHGADEQSDYSVLHTKMAAQGFSKTITNSSGTEYNLPSAEYNKETNDDIDAVLASAKKATAATESECGLTEKSSILVTQSAARRWSNLEPT